MATGSMNRDEPIRHPRIQSDRVAAEAMAAKLARSCGQEQDVWFDRNSETYRIEHSRDRNHIIMYLPTYLLMVGAVKATEGAE